MTLLYKPTPPRMDWFNHDRFGISFHWGLYAAPARGEWVRSSERMSIADYQRYFESFNPDRYDPRSWARLAKRAGMKYAVLTTKHHDGFCLWDSKLTDYKATNTPAGRDLIREYVEAFRAEGLKVGLYYSLVDWHHPDYPAWRDRQHPSRHDPAFKDKPCDWSRYVTYMHGQVRELLTNYGKIDWIHFDFSYWEYRGEKWGADELVKMMRQLQPEIIINDRLGGDIKQADPPSWAGDFDSPEQNIPPDPVVNARGEVLPWEGWITLTNSWGYSASDDGWKSPAMIIRTLVNCVSKGGNLLVNLSPDARGGLQTQAVKILEEVGDWMALNGESVYGCGIAEFPRPEWGRYTQRGDTLYAHVLEPTIGHLLLPDMRGKIRNARQLATGAEAFITDFWNGGVQTFGKKEDIFFNFAKPVAQTHSLPDARDTVVAFDLVPREEQAAEAKRQTMDVERREPF